MKHLFHLLIIVLFVSGCSTANDQKNIELQKENIALKNELDNKTKLLNEIIEKNNSLETDFDNTLFVLQEHIDKGQDWRYWTYELQKSLLNELYEKKDIKNFINLSIVLIDYKSRELEIGKDLSFYNPVNVGAQNNDVEIIKTILDIDPSLINKASANYNMVPDSPKIPLSIAIESNSIDVVKFFLDKSVPFPERRYIVNDFYDGWPINALIISPSYQMTDLLIEKGLPAIIDVPSPVLVSK